MKYSFARSFDRQQRGVHARAAALRDRVQADVDSGARNVCGCGALIQSRSGIRVAEQRNREPPNVEFMPQQPRKSQGDVFLGEFIRQSGTAFFAAVRRIDNGENAMDISIIVIRIAIGIARGDVCTRWRTVAGPACGFCGPGPTTFGVAGVCGAAEPMTVEIMIVLRSVLKVANSGSLAARSNSASPLFSE